MRKIFNIILVMMLVCRGIQSVNAQRKKTVTIGTDFDGSGRGSSRSVQ